jgi:hypothetical protein
MPNGAKISVNSRRRLRLSRQKCKIAESKRAGPLLRLSTPRPARMASTPRFFNRRGALLVGSQNRCRPRSQHTCDARENAYWNASVPVELGTSASTQSPRSIA